MPIMLTIVSVTRGGTVPGGGRRCTRAFAWLLLRVLILPLARRTVVIVVAGSRIMLAAAEPIEKATRLRPGPLPVGLILLVPVPEKLGLHCHAGRLG